ncbi:MAG: ATP-binding protein [Chloroflexota bacterium]
MAKENGIPKWTQEMLSKYKSGIAHAFILHFNIADYVIPGIDMRNYLTKLMANRQMTVFYNRSEGITFGSPSMEKKFKEMLGLTKPSQTDPALVALGIGVADSELPRDPSAALPLLEKLLRMGNANDKLCAIIIEYAETVCPPADMSSMSAGDRVNLVTLSRWGRDPQISASGNPIFLLAENLTDIHTSIRAASSRYEAIEIPLPGFDERLNFIEKYLQREDRLDTFDITPQEMANATAGLSILSIEDIFLRAELEGKLSNDLIKERKRDIIRSEFGEVLEVMEPAVGFEAIGGLQHVKDFFVRCVIDPIRKGNYNRVPMGILMTGPAGTGKSIMAEAVAKEAGVNAVSLNLARILGQYVGASERNLEKALRAIESLSPTIVFMDEIDQSVNRGQGGDSGVSNRIFKRLLEFMSEGKHRGHIVFLAATNRPDLMDAALKRPGRFDKKIPFLIPDENERKEIFRVLSRKYIPAGVFPQDVKLYEVIQITEGWTGAEIEAAVVKTVELMEDLQIDMVQGLVEAVTRLSPSTADIEFMTMLAIQETNDKDLLPEKYRKSLDDRKELTEKIRMTTPSERGKRDL